AAEPGSFSAGRLGRPPADRAGVAAGQTLALAVGADAELLEDAEELADRADEQPLLLDLHPDAGACREDHVVAGGDRHLHSGLLPPVEAGADRDDDPVLGRRLAGAGRDHETRLADPVAPELLGVDPIGERGEDAPRPR